MTFLHSDMTVLMKLSGGPLDGEQQIVEMLPISAGATLFFNIPNFQTFDPSSMTETVTGLGLQAYYAYSAPGPGPGIGDSWTASYVYDFTGEAYVPTPGPKPPEGIQPLPVTVSMSADTTLVPDTLPIITSPGVALVAESDMDVDALITPFQYGIVAMTGESVLSITPDWTPLVTMSDTTSLLVIGLDIPEPHFIQGTGNTASGVTSMNLAFGSNVVAGDLIAVGALWFTPSTNVGVVTDSQGNTYQEAVWQLSATSNWIGAIFYTTAAASGPLTVTLTMPASGNLVLSLCEYSNVDTLDQTNSATANGPGPGVQNSGNVTTTHPVEVMVGLILDTSGGLGAGSGWTLATPFPNYCVQEYEIVGSTGTHAATATGGGSTWAAIIATFYKMGF